MVEEWKAPHCPMSGRLERNLWTCGRNGWAWGLRVFYLCVAWTDAQECEFQMQGHGELPQQGFPCPFAGGIRTESERLCCDLIDPLSNFSEQSRLRQWFFSRCSMCCPQHDVGPQAWWLIRRAGSCRWCAWRRPRACGRSALLSFLQTPLGGHQIPTLYLLCSLHGPRHASTYYFSVSVQFWVSGSSERNFPLPSTTFCKKS